MTAEMERRRVATQKTIDRFRGKPFAWDKSATCAHLLRYHLRNMGHKALTVPQFRTPLGATKALNAMGFTSMADVLDSLAKRLPGAAYTVLGDVVVKDGDGLDAVMICAGPRRFYGWIEGEEKPVFAEIDPDYLVGCWRV